MCKNIFKLIFALSFLIFSFGAIYYGMVSNVKSAKIQKEIKQQLTNRAQEELNFDLDNDAEVFLAKQMKRCFYSIKYNINLNKSEEYKVISDCLSKYKNDAESQRDYIERASLENKVRERAKFY
jgi:hypothetical protein